MRFLTLVAATVAAAALFTLQHASAFTIVNQSGNSGGAHVADPDEQVRSNVGAQGRGRGAAPSRNAVPMFSGVMPDTHDIMPPPASLFQTAPTKRAKAKVTVKPTKSADASPRNSTVRDMSQPLPGASR